MNDQYDRLIVRMVELMSSLLNDLIENRERFTPVKIMFGRDLFRVQYDQSDLTETPVQEVRDSLVRVLSERIFERLLRATPEEKREMAEEAIEVERDPCAAEYAGKDFSKFGVWIPERLPQPFPHMVQWIVNLAYLEELHTGIRLFLEDLVHEEADWSRSRSYIDGSLESLRELAPSSAGTATPRRVRNWMNAAATISSVARLGNLSDADWNSLLSHLDNHLYSQPRGLRPSPGPDIRTASGPDHGLGDRAICFAGVRGSSCGAVWGHAAMPGGVDRERNSCGAGNLLDRTGTD
jgi:hypothetical protein